MQGSNTFTFEITLQGEIKLAQNPNDNFFFTKKVLKELLLKLFKSLPPINPSNGCSISFKKNNVIVSKIRVKSS